MVILVILMSGCVLGPQPEPPDVIGDQAAREDPGYTGDAADAGGAFPDDDSFADLDEDPGPCDQGLAGGEWNCDGDRDGHEPSCPEGELDMGFVHPLAIATNPADRFFDDEDDEYDPSDTTTHDDLSPDDEDEDDGDDDDDDDPDIAVVTF